MVQFKGLLAAGCERHAGSRASDRTALGRAGIPLPVLFPEGCTCSSPSGAGSSEPSHSVMTWSRPCPPPSHG